MTRIVWSGSGPRDAHLASTSEKQTVGGSADCGVTITNVTPPISEIIDIWCAGCRTLMEDHETDDGNWTSLRAGLRHVVGLIALVDTDKDDSYCESLAVVSACGEWWGNRDFLERGKTADCLACLAGGMP